MASGVLGVPIHLFFISVLVGLMPYNYLCVTSGAILSEINDLGDIVSWSNMARWISSKVSGGGKFPLLQVCHCCPCCSASNSLVERQENSERPGTWWTPAAQRTSVHKWTKERTLRWRKDRWSWGRGYFSGTWSSGWEKLICCIS